MWYRRVDGGGMRQTGVGGMSRVGECGCSGGVKLNWSWVDGVGGVRWRG